MDIAGGAPDVPVVIDDPWATVVAPVIGPVTVPLPSGVVKPTLPWADGVAEPDEVAEADDVAEAVPERDVVQATPELVPTAVGASSQKDSFPPGVATKLAVYVYLLTDERTGRPFFVGQGRGNRCFRHVEAARAKRPSTLPTDDSLPAGKQSTASRPNKPNKPNKPTKPAKFPLLDRIIEAESDGRPVGIEILRHGLDAVAADLVVASVDDALGLGLGSAEQSQRARAIDVGAGLAKRATFKRAHQMVLLRVGGRGTDTTYELARRGWPIDPQWTDLESRRAPRWAAVVAGDLVDAVYRIDSWEPSTAPAGPIERYSFSGTRDVELDDRYVGRSARGHLGTGTPGQVTYVWSGPEWTDTAN